MNKFLLKLLINFCLFIPFTALTVESKIPLQIIIPMPLISANGPVPVSGNNLEPLHVGRRPDFFVPVGTTNLALLKPVTASCQATLGNLNMVTDGDKDGDEGGWVELKAGQQWVQIDLQNPPEIYAVIVWHFHFKDRVYQNVVVAVSDDPEFKKDVKVIFNNDTENVIGFGKGSDFNYLDNYMGKLIDAKGVKGRYIRLYSNGNNVDKMNHYVEVEVFGKPIM